MARRQNTRPLREIAPTIIGAGITEKYYFLHLKSLCSYRVEVKPRYFGSDTAYDMRKQVEDVLSAGGMAICVYDMDTTTWDAVERERKDSFVRDYQQHRHVILCPSMPSIEYWFLLHFEKTNRESGTSDKVIQVLSKYMSYSKEGTFLEKVGWVKQLLENRGMETAISNALSLAHNGASYTDIHRVIQFLDSHHN